MRIGTKTYGHKTAPNLKTDPVGWRPAESPLEIMQITENYLKVKHCTWPVPETVIYSSCDTDLIYNEHIWVVVGSNWSVNLKSVATTEGGLFSVSPCPLTAVWWLTFPARSRVLPGGCFGVMVEYNDIRTLVWGLKNNLSVVGSWRHVPVI